MLDVRYFEEVLFEETVLLNARFRYSSAAYRAREIG